MFKTTRNGFSWVTLGMVTQLSHIVFKQPISWDGNLWMMGHRSKAIRQGIPHKDFFLPVSSYFFLQWLPGFAQKCNIPSIEIEGHRELLTQHWIFHGIWCLTDTAALAEEQIFGFKPRQSWRVSLVFPASVDGKHQRTSAATKLYTWLAPKRFLLHALHAAWNRPFTGLQVSKHWENWI